MSRQPSAQRSSFVTVLAWSGIVLGAFSALLSALQVVIVVEFFSIDEISIAFEETIQSEEMALLPWFGKAALANMQWLSILPLVISLATLIVSLGLLRRKNWARIASIVALGLNLVFAFLGTIFLWTSVCCGDLPEAISGSANFDTMFWSVQLTVTALNIVCAGLSVWIIWRLTRIPVKHEFGVGEFPAAGQG